MPAPTAAARVTPMMAFCSVVMAMVLIAVAIVVVGTIVPARAAAVVEMAATSPAGAAWMALAERRTTRPQALDGAAHSFLRGVIGGAQQRADLAQRLVLEVAEENGSAVRFIERFHRVIQQQLDARP